MTTKNTKLVKSKTKKVYKNKKLNNANFGTYNLNDYQVFLQLISKLGGVDESGTYLQPEQLHREHLLTAKEFSQQFGVDIDSCYRILKNAGKRLMETSITLEKPDLFVTQQINVCSKIEYLHKEGSIKVKFTDDIMPYLAQVKKKFVLYNLKEVANFGSIYSTRLYELIQEFKDTGWLIKSVEQLRGVFAVGKKFKMYNDFKRFTFAHATDEINSQYEIDLKFEEIKEGRKVIAIRFEFKPTFIRRTVDPYTGKERNIYIKPKAKSLTPEQIREREEKKNARAFARMEAKIIAENIKKYGNDRGIDVDAAYAVQRDWENYQRYLKEQEERGIHPDQQGLFE
jgi:plasmid replication initiation protein